jgi:membrane-associated phospholipid phosphatase
MPVRSSLTRHAWRTPARIATALVALALITACASDKSGPTEVNARADAARSGVPFDVGLASPAWQEAARGFVSDAKFSPLAAGHAYPLLGVAQYLAVQKAQAAISGGGRVRLESDRGAVAGASAVVLTALFPANTQAIHDLLTAQANAGPGQPHPAFAAGEAIGRAVGADVVARIITDKFNVSIDPTPLKGDGYWTTNADGLAVIGGQMPGVTRWFPIARVDYFRPAAPPAFGSDEFIAARDTIRAITDTRTFVQDSIAKFWALNAGTPTAAGFWLARASDGIAKNGLSEREATHLYALMSATMFDAAISCWDAKLAYWLIRPWKADDKIKTILAVGRPNHPSYPSGHSCVSSSGAEVLATFFPDQREHLNAMVTEAGRSRMYAGIHYKFDCEIGQALGRSVAAFTIKADASGSSVMTPRW